MSQNLRCQYCQIIIKVATTAKQTNNKNTVVTRALFAFIHYHFHFNFISKPNTHAVSWLCLYFTFLCMCLCKC